MTPRAPLAAVPTLDELAADPARAAKVSAEVRVTLLARAMAVVGALAAPALAGPPPAPRDDRLLDVPEVARRLAVSEDYDLVAATAVRSLAWAHRMIFRAAMKRLLAGEHPLTVAAELRLETRRVYSRLERGLEGFGA